MKRFKLFVLYTFIFCGLLGCATQPNPEINYDPAALQFDGEQAFVTETAFVTQFPDRDSGQPNNRLAAEWLQTQFTELGLTCKVQAWEVINFSQPLPLNNVVCSLPGKSAQEIVILAHHDQFAGTTQGADNDGSGIAIMLELAKIFAAEGQPAYTLTFLSSDGEEYGMLGSGHYIETHPDPAQIIAAFSLDNLGKKFYDGVRMSATGQLDDVGPLWLQRTAQEAARTAGDIWVPAMKPTYEQMLTQAVPISMWDQGPLVAAGVPAIGFGENCPAAICSRMLGYLPFGVGYVGISVSRHAASSRSGCRSIGTAVVGYGAIPTGIWPLSLFSRIQFGFARATLMACHDWFCGFVFTRQFVGG